MSGLTHTHSSKLEAQGIPLTPSETLAIVPTQQSDSGYDNPQNPVEDREHLDTKHSRHGTAVTEVFTMQNGRQYEVVSGAPLNQRVDVPVVFTTALGTSIRGHNWHSMLSIMNLGYPVVMVGPEGGHANWPHNLEELKLLYHNIRTISTKETAENTHQILHETDSDGVYKPGNFIQIGESRAGMTALGVRSQAARFGRTALYDDLTAPCFPIPHDQRGHHESVMIEAIKQTSGAALIPLQMSLSRSKHYPATINLNPFYTAHMLATIPTLISGVTGELARSIETTSNMHITLFKNDTWSCPDEWKSLFKQHANVVNRVEPGTHMTIINKKTQSDRLSRLANLLQELESGDISRVDWRNVHLGRLALAS